MPNLDLVTLQASNDEPAYNYGEINRNGRRMKVIQLKRGDRFPQYWEDMGPEEDFTASEFYIPAYIPSSYGIESAHTVGELLDIGNEMREAQVDKDRVHRSDLIQGYWDEMDRKQKGAMSTFGFGGNTVR
tara:strand:- start:782 stop:1171 length:390 start_codon:yes stop_codon:yes gene_type:complete